MTSSGKSVYRWDQERLGAALSVLVFSVGACSVLVCVAVYPLWATCWVVLWVHFLAAPAHVATPSCTPLMREKKKQKSGEARS